MAAAAIRWNAGQYLAFSGPRTRPAIDLLQHATTIFSQGHQTAIKAHQSGLLSGAASVLTSLRSKHGPKVMDLGCGAGHMMPLLRQTLSASHVEGLDLSEDMLTHAAQRLLLDTEEPRLQVITHSEGRFLIPVDPAGNIQGEKSSSSWSQLAKSARYSLRQTSIEQEVRFAPHGAFDIVFANASLHWVEDHQTLLPALVETLVNPYGGVLAMQMPDTRQQPSHCLMDVAVDAIGESHTVQNVRIPRCEQAPDWYYQLLSPLCDHIETWVTDYIDYLPATKDGERHPVLTFTSSTALQPYLNALGGEGSEKCNQFLDKYDELLRVAYPTRTIKIGRNQTTTDVVPFVFRRFFLVGRRD